MPSTSETRNRNLDKIPGVCPQVPSMYAAMPAAFGMLPWQQAAQHPQQFAYPLPFPVVMPQINPHQWGFPVDNYTSLPPKAKVENGDCASPAHEPVTKPTRRFSDPGPLLTDVVREKFESSLLTEAKDSPRCDEDPFVGEIHLFAEEARKDRIFSNLLQELRTARNLNRQLCLELHKAKMQIQLLQQQTNTEQPGSVAVLVRKLYEAHQIRSEILSQWNKTEDPFQTFVRRNSYINKMDQAEESEHLLMKEREMLMSRLQSNEKKFQTLRNAQWNGSGMEGIGVGVGNYYQKAAAAAASELRPPVNSRCLDDVLSSSSVKLSRSHSFALTASDPSTSDPPSLDDLDIISHHHQHASKHGGTCSLTNSAALLSNPHRAHHEAGRAAIPAGNYSNHSLGSLTPSAPLSSNQHLAATVTGVAAAMAPPASSDSMKRDLEHQLAIVERDRRQLELELRDSLGARRISEDRVTKLERLVSVLRKKLEAQAPTTTDTRSTHSNLANGPNGSSIPPSPVANSHHQSRQQQHQQQQQQQQQRSPVLHCAIPSSPSIASSSSPPLPPAEFRPSGAGSPAFRALHHHAVDGPASLPSYLQVVGPITQL